MHGAFPGVHLLKSTDPHSPPAANLNFKLKVARARKINRRAWNNNKERERVRGTKLCDVNAQLSDRIHLHSLTQRKCKTHANAAAAAARRHKFEFHRAFIEEIIAPPRRIMLFSVCFNLVCARPPREITHTVNKRILLFFCCK